MKDNKPGGMFFRTEELDLEVRAKDDGTMDLSFSSQARVRRWYGIEVLSHRPGSVNLRILNSVLFNHDANQIIGPVRSKKIEGGRGVATMAFDETDCGTTAKKRVESKSLRGVSVGYTVEKFRKLQDGEDFELDGEVIRGTPESNPTYIAVNWTPREVTLTPIPADGSVGVGRMECRSLDGIEIEERETPAKPAATAVETDKGGSTVMNEEEKRALLDEQKKRNAAELRTILDRASTQGDSGIATAMRMHTEGKTVDEITDALLQMGKKERGTPSGAKEGEVPTHDQRLKDISDDDFARSLASPTILEFN